MPVEHATSKSAGDEHAAAGEPIRPVSTGMMRTASYKLAPTTATPARGA
jgi:hypothetical protein